MSKFTAAIQKAGCKTLKKLKLPERNRSEARREGNCNKTGSNKSMNGCFEICFGKIRAKRSKVVKKEHWRPAHKFNVIFEKKGTNEKEQ